MNKNKYDDTSLSFGDYKADDRLVKIFRDYSKNYSDNKVFKLLFWTEGLENEQDTINNYYINYGICKVNGLSEVLEFKPLIYFKIDDKILLIRTDINQSISLSNQHLKKLVNLIQPFVDKDVEIINYDPIEYKTKIPSVLDDKPYGKIYVFKNDKLIKTERWMGLFKCGLIEKK
jgi:hypothetical protein